MKKNEVNHIKELLEKYFNAETTLEEEEILRRYFEGENTDEELLSYKPLFNCFSHERSQAGVITDSAKPLSRRNNIYFRLSSFSVAAAFAIFAYIVFSERKDSLKLVVDGIDINNNELAISKADRQMEKINSFMGKYREGSSRQLENIKKSGEALSSLKIFDKALSHN